MSALAHESTHVSSILPGLQSLVHDQQDSIDWLVITHDDPTLTRRLSSAVNGKAAVMLQVPQSDWCFDNGDLIESIVWSIKEAKIKHLLLAGHSKVDTLAGDGAIAGDRLSDLAAADARSSGYGRLVRGAQQARRQIQQAKDDFVERMERLVEIDEVCSAMSSGQLELHTLFYIDQNGTFLSYDRSTRAFASIED